MTNTHIQKRVDGRFDAGDNNGDGEPVHGEISEDLESLTMSEVCSMASLINALR